LVGTVPVRYLLDLTTTYLPTGAVKAIFSKGVKYAEQVRDSTKTAISVMFCGSATGVMMPPYVVYKAENVYHSWMKKGIKDAIYNSSISDRGQ